MRPACFSNEGCIMNSMKKEWKSDWDTLTDEQQSQRIHDVVWNDKDDKPYNKRGIFSNLGFTVFAAVTALILIGGVSSGDIAFAGISMMAWMIVVAAWGLKSLS